MVSVFNISNIILGIKVILIKKSIHKMHIELIILYEKKYDRAYFIKLITLYY
jgi:hypothetical protein